MDTSQTTQMFRTLGKAMDACDMCEFYNFPFVLSKNLLIEKIVFLVPMSRSEARLETGIHCILLVPETVKSLSFHRFNNDYKILTKFSAPACVGVTLDTTYLSTLDTDNLPYSIRTGSLLSGESNYISYTKRSCSKLKQWLKFNNFVESSNTIIFDCYKYKSQQSPTYYRQLWFIGIMLVLWSAFQGMLKYTETLARLWGFGRHPVPHTLYHPPRQKQAMRWSSDSLIMWVANS